MVERTGVSGASDPKRPARGSGPLPSEPPTWIPVVIDSNPLLCRPRVSATQYAITNSVDAAKETLDAFLRFCRKAHKLRRFVLQFRAMLRWRSARQLNTWIVSAAVSGFRFTTQFARTLRRDLEVVKLSMTTSWSTGPIEGHINRLKVLKRQMHGRAGFELLKARVLPWDASNAA